MTSRSLLLAAILSVTLASDLHAAGPLLVNGAGTPLVWVPPVPFEPDLGPLGILDNASAVARVSASFSVWSAVPTSSVSFTNAGALPVDVTVANYPGYVGVCGDGRSPIVFDDDGSITDDLFGAGASSFVLGFAGPDCGNYATATISEGSAVLNGRFIDGIDTQANPEISLADFDQVFIHEFGHYVNLDHSQIGLAEAFDAAPGNDDDVATMFPYSVNGAAQSSLTLDDRVSLSTLYPGAGFASGHGRITGDVVRSDGTTPFQGAYVIARAVGDPRATAVGQASGARYFPGNPGGPPLPGLQRLFELPGLPPGSYTLEIESIHPLFVGGSSVGPLDPPVALPGPAEFWNGASEAAMDPPDDPAAADLVSVSAGLTASGRNFVINVVPPAPNDACAAPTVVAATPFADTTDTSGATTEAGDPLQSCSTGGAATNANSVWYSFTAPATGILTADTYGSGYDTVLTAFSGSCGALSELACNDDVEPFVSLDSRLEIGVLAGSTYLLEVTKYGPPGGGILRLALGFAPFDETGVPPPDRTTGRCEGSVARAFGKYAAGVLKCHTKAAAAGLAGTPFDEELCESDPATGGGVQERYESAIARLASRCGAGACYLANAPALATLTESFLDQRNGDVYCAGTTPFGGELTGFVPPDGATARCEETVARAFSRYVGAVIKCHVRMLETLARGRVEDDEACEQKAAARVEATLARVAGDCAGCALGNAPALLDAAHAFLDENNGLVYCQP